MREAIEAAQAERQAGIPGIPGIPGRPVPVIGSTLLFYVACRLAEDCLIVPRIIGHAVHVHALAGMIAIVLGGVPPGIIAALIAIPVAAAISLILNEVTFRHLDSS